MEPAAAFNESSRRYLAAWYAAEPVFASILGIRGFDDRLPEVTRRSEAETLWRARTFLHEIDRISLASLPPSERIDYRIARAGVQMTIAELEILRPRVRQPAVHAATLQAALSSLLLPPSRPIERLAVAALGRMRAFPRYLAQASALLEPTDPLLREAGIEAFRHLAGYLEFASSEAADRLPNIGLRQSFRAGASDAIQAVVDFQAYLEGTPVNRESSFAIGREHYEYVLRIGHVTEESIADLCTAAEEEAIETERQLRKYEDSKYGHFERDNAELSVLKPLEMLAWPFWCEPPRERQEPRSEERSPVRRHFAWSGLTAIAEPIFRHTSNGDRATTAQRNELYDRLLDACLLLADTGLHAFGWEPRRAIALLDERAGLSHDVARSVVAQMAHAPTWLATRFLGKRQMRDLEEELRRRNAERNSASVIAAVIAREGLLPPRLLRVSLAEI